MNYLSKYQIKLISILLKWILIRFETLVTVKMNYSHMAFVFYFYSVTINPVLVLCWKGNFQLLVAKETQCSFIFQIRKLRNWHFKSILSLLSFLHSLPCLNELDKHYLCIQQLQFVLFFYLAFNLCFVNFFKRTKKVFCHVFVMILSILKELTALTTFV